MNLGDETEVLEADTAQDGEKPFTPIKSKPGAKARVVIEKGYLYTPPLFTAARLL